MYKKLLINAALIIISQYCYALESSPVNKLYSTLEPIAKIANIDFDANLSSFDIGSYKEFYININDQSSYDIKVRRLYKGKLLRTSIILNPEQQSLRIKLVEKDEQSPTGLDNLAIAPLNFFNTDDLFIDTDIDLKDQKIEVNLFEDNVKITLSGTRILDGPSLLNTMKNMIKKCDSNIKNSKIFCRNFYEALHLLEDIGFSREEQIAIAKELHPKITSKIVNQSLNSTL